MSIPLASRRLESSYRHCRVAVGLASRLPRQAGRGSVGATFLGFVTLASTVTPRAGRAALGNLTSARSVAT
jgi:hypothetical protein